jgi:hypothetical protein
MIQSGILLPLIKVILKSMESALLDIIVMVLPKQHAELANSNHQKPLQVSLSAKIVCMGTTVKLESTI